MELSIRSLIKISLIGFLTIFVIIFYIDNNFDLITRDIDSISLKELDRNVKIKGNVVASNVRGNNLFVVLKGNNSTIKGVMFNSNSTPTVGENYSIEGIVKTYKGEVEIIIHKIEDDNQ